MGMSTGAAAALMTRDRGGGVINLPNAFCTIRVYQRDGELMAEKKLRFKVKLEGEEGSTATWMNAPFDVQETFGTKARVPVRGTMNDFPFRSSLMPMGGCHGMAVNRAMREGAKAQAGDLVDVVLQRDSEERTVEAPTELKKELAKNKKAQERW